MWCRPRSILRACAMPAMSPSARLTTSFKSTACSWSPLAALASWRASTSSCSTRRVARSMPALTREMARLRFSSDSARSRLKTCNFRAASGVRSSCAASATKCCCASNAVFTRPNSRLSSCTRGRTSSGKPASETGDRSSAWRAATCLRTRETGASEPLTTHQTTSIRIGAISAMGPTVRSARLPAMRFLTAMSWAICTVWELVCTEKMR